MSASTDCIKNIPKYKQGLLYVAHGSVGHLSDFSFWVVLTNLCGVRWWVHWQLGDLG